MRSLLKTVVLAATLGLGAVSAAQAATVTTTNTYLLGAGNYDVAEPVLTNGVSATLTLLSGLGTLNVFAGGATLFNETIYAGFTRSFSFASGTSLFASLNLLDLSFVGVPAPVAKVVVTEFETIPDPVPLPATAPLLLGAFAVVGALARRRKAA